MKALSILSVKNLLLRSPKVYGRGKDALIKTQEFNTTERQRVLELVMQEVTVARCSAGSRGWVAGLL